MTPIKTPYGGALRCLNRGWRVAPLPVGKKFAPPDGYLDAPLVGVAKLKQWEANRPGRNYAVIPGLSLTMLDVDPKSGGPASLDLLEVEYGTLPPTFTVRTPSGGTHYYFRGLHTFKLKFRPGLDAPQYVVAPWSVVDGKRYDVIDGRALAPIPNWLPEVIGSPDPTDDAEQVSEIELDQSAAIERAIWYLTHDARPSIQGQGGEFALLLAFGNLKDFGISKHTAIELIDQHYNVEPRCSPLWLLGDGPIADRLDVKAENAWRYLTKTRPGSASAQADFADDPVSDADVARAAELAAVNDDGLTPQARQRKARREYRRRKHSERWGEVP
jgi:Bifunctional DNA primase/polymerase, N-terminal